MTYATQQNLVDRFGSEELLALADRDGDDAVDTAVVDAALADADALIDSYIGRRYTLPLASTPARLVTVAATIARYELAADRPTEQMRQDYDDAVAWLRDVAAGRAELQIEGDEPTGEAVTIKTSGPERVFSRTTLRGF